MAGKPKIALYWCASCGGCEETVVDLDERILDVVAAVDIVFWPCAMDFKYSDVEAMADKSIAVSFINGAIRTTEQEHVAKLLRRKSGLVVAFGDCAWMGGIPALANLSNRREIFDRAYGPGPTTVNPEGVMPQPGGMLDGRTATLPAMYDTVLRLSDVIEVDYFLPGCPPTSDLVAGAVTAILTGALPAKGSVLASDKSLCTTCDRNASKPDSLTVDSFRRVTQVAVDPTKCLLAQGVVCMGPATRDGCGFPCVKGNMPCTGCFGPVSGADQGARMVAALGGILDTSNAATREALAGIPDPAGSFYRYGMSASLLGSKRKEAGA